MTHFCLHAERGAHVSIMDCITNIELICQAWSKITNMDSRCPVWNGIANIEPTYQVWSNITHIYSLNIQYGLV